MIVSLCIVGVVGNLYSDKKGYNHNQDVDYRIGYEHFKRYLFETNPDIKFDTHIFSWSTKYKDEIIETYKPVSHCFTPQIEFNQNTKRLDYTLSRWFATSQVIKQKMFYESSKNIQYDWVILTRFDWALKKPMILASYDQSKFYATHDLEHNPVTSKQVCPCYYSDRFLDYAFWSNTDNMNKFSLLVNHWQQYNIFNAHRESFHHANQMGLDIAYDLTESVDHDLVRAIYEDCHYQGINYPGIDKLKQFNKYPRERF